jgi:hypothetical protein
MQERCNVEIELLSEESALAVEPIVELDDAELQRVVGGGPNGTWASCFAGPNNNW